MPAVAPQMLRSSNGSTKNVRVPFPLTLDPFEVAEAFEVPLDFVLDPANHRRTERVFEHRVRVFFVLPFEDRNIWGATAGMLVTLYRLCALEQP